MRIWRSKLLGSVTGDAYVISVAEPSTLSAGGDWELRVASVAPASESEPSSSTAGLLPPVPRARN
jgi:hypothetical protein